jgi:hypothetical protein
VAAWFNKKAIVALAKMAEKLKAESQARAEAEEKLKAEIESKAALERKVKDEAEKLLIAQYNKYRDQVEETKAKAEEEVVTARAQIKEAEEKVRSYDAALIETRKKLSETQEQLEAEAFARAEAEEKLKSESEERKRIEAQIEEAIASGEARVGEEVKSYEAALMETQGKLKEAQEQLKAEGLVRAEAEEKVRSYEAALAEAQEQLSEAKERLRAEALARAEAEERLKSKSEEQKRRETPAEEAIVTTKAEAEEKVQSSEAALTEIREKLTKAKGQVRTKAVAKARGVSKVDIQERRRFFEQPVEGIYVLGQNRRSIFHLGDIRRKIVLLLVLGIFSALTFALSVTDNPPVSGPGDIEIQEKTPERDSSVRSDADRERPDSEATADALPEDPEATSSGMTNASSLENEGIEKNAVEADKEKTVPASDTQLLIIMTSPEPLKITASAGGKSDIVQFSDDNRLETRIGSSLYYEFSDVSVPANAAIKSVVLFIEHFEEERFAEGKLEWAVGTGWPDRPAVWAKIKAPVYKGQSNESVDAWDITSVVDTVEKINSLQLQIKNNNRGAYGKTLVDYVYVIIEYN